MADREKPASADPFQYVRHAAALVYKFCDANQRSLEPLPVHYRRHRKHQQTRLWQEAPSCRVSRRGNQITGQAGTIYTFGSQKGLSPEEVETLDCELAKFVGTVERELDVNHATVPRTGAAGGLGYGIL